MKNILHISDLHAGTGFLSTRFATTVCNKIQNDFDSRHTVIVLTGDLVDEPSDLSYTIVRDCLDQLRKKGFTILVCPGNHDYTYGINLIDGKDRINIYAFQSYYSLPSTEYPIVYDKIDSGMVFIALDTMAVDADWGNIEYSQGKIGHKQLERLNSILAKYEAQNSQKEIILFMHHRPFEWDERIGGVIRTYNKLKLLDTSEFLNTVSPNNQSRISMLLFGHSHLFQIWNNQNGIPLCCDAGTTTGKGNDAKIGTVCYVEYNNGTWQARMIDWGFEI